MEQKKWRPQDYFGWSESNGSSMAEAMRRAVDDLKSQVEIQQEQERMLGQGDVPINRSVQRRMMLMKQMGIDPSMIDTPLNSGPSEEDHERALELGINLYPLGER
ncbi:MAG: hypothetical protein OM95_06960 [Bdellovibrio sp. ArHS]|uniref:hypothetical protein n=1 Tax=Bdellovibrio sp. ArHS TaxID=1569284 RepID=UPI000582EEE8|nr:hypothetical protein [Bdellovibrio sp. ArHS]KHD88850.1 MAG: hypothetical protein OM95_06960 [Bdellovibrio sp. ArHS]